MAQQQLVVFIRHDQWRVLHFKGRQYQSLRSFFANKESHLLLLDLLKQHAGAIVYFITDIADEHYHVEVLPHVGGAARKQLLARRLAAWPFAQGLHTVHSLDRVQNVRKEDRYLFSAIHYPPLQDWLQALEQHIVYTRGVYSLALCFPCVISDPQKASAHCLYIYFERQQLRIHYLCKTKLFFSRLLTLPPSESLPQRISNEVAQTRLYLISQQWLPENESLHMVWLSDDGTASGLSEEQLPAAIKLTCKTFTEVIHRPSRVHQPEELNAMDWAAVQCVLNGQPLPNFAPEINLLGDRIQRAKRSITMAGAIMFTACLGICWLVQQAINNTQFTIQQTKTSISQWQAAKPAWGFADADLPRLQTLALAVQRIESSVHMPDKALIMLQNVMANQTVWQVKKIEWQYGPALDKASPSNNQWYETVSVTFFRKDNTASLNARQEWQLLLDHLRQHPDILELKELHSSPTSAHLEQNGDTRQLSLPDDQPMINIRLRPLEKAAV